MAFTTRLARDVARLAIDQPTDFLKVQALIAELLQDDEDDDDDE